MVEGFETCLGGQTNSLTFQRKAILPARREQALAQFTYMMYRWLITPTQAKAVFSTPLTEQYQYVLLVIPLVFLH